ncbi:hypothetical protein AB1Y20_006655 [Prymnesium parvum]|uniref:VOC domain-containing protein n=1 Tax=Prymnesium parvum TaxID=97485 RepID=A0AB34IZ03_PRYPA
MAASPLLLLLLAPPTLALRATLPAEPTRTRAPSSPRRPLLATPSAASVRAAVRLALPAPRGSLTRVVHRVADAAAVAGFYAGAFGFQAASVEGADGRERQLLTGAGKSLQLELIGTEGALFNEGASYKGLSIRVPDVAAAVAAAVDNGGSVLEDAKEILHGPSNQPVEADDVITPVMEAVVADPNGFPVHLYQANCSESAICGVRLDVYEWKKSSEWYQSELGWKTLRWQSHVPRHASLSVLIGGPESEGTIGPVGALSEDQPSPLISLRYVYGSPAPKKSSALEALVLAAGDGSPTELKDPDANSIQLV